MNHSTPCRSASFDSRDCIPEWPLDVRFVPLLAAGAVAVAVGLVAVGVSWISAFMGTAIVSLCLVYAARDAWRRPERYATVRVLTNAVRGFVLACIGSMIPYITGDLMQHGDFDAVRLVPVLQDALRRSAPVMALIVVAAIVLMTTVARVKRVRTERELAWLRVVQERDATARQLAEARLKLLQGQIQPHFVFNTLAAIQHWVDVADPRAGPLLHALTAFLRGSTDLMDRERTTLSIEVDTVRHYLSIMRARLGDRLRTGIAIDDAAGGQPVPPGLLLTLVENAIDHGIAPALRGGTVRIDARDDGRCWVLEVRDDGVGLSAGWAEGIGLANCRERLAHVSGGRATLSLATVGAETVATVRIEHGSTP